MWQGQADQACQCMDVCIDIRNRPRFKAMHAGLWDRSCKATRISANPTSYSQTHAHRPHASAVTRSRHHMRCPEAPAAQPAGWLPVAAAWQRLHHSPGAPALPTSRRGRSAAALAALLPPLAGAPCCCRQHPPAPCPAPASRAPACLCHTKRHFSLFGNSLNSLVLATHASSCAQSTF